MFAGTANFNLVLDRIWEVPRFIVIHFGINEIVGPLLTQGRQIEKIKLPDIPNMEFIYPKADNVTS